MLTTLEQVLQRLDDGDMVWQQCVDLCALGGRFAGSESERDAKEHLLEQLTAISPSVTSHPVDYAGWERGESSLQANGRRYRCEALVRSPATPHDGLVTELVDLGRGEQQDFERHASDIAGRIVLVRHEYMFATNTVHRRRKYEWAMQHHAAGFLIANHLDNDWPVTGSSGARPGRGIPAAGISAKTASALTTHYLPGARIRLQVESREIVARTENIVLELPGQSDEWVVLCAHLDGHHLAQSAMDNATGVAAVLAIANAIAVSTGHLQRGLRVILFNVEEWALTGSTRYVQGLSDTERRSIAGVINLDSIAGSDQLTALSSGYHACEPFLVEAASAAGLSLGVHRPIMANSDHYPFAVNGVPAARIVAGFEQPTSNLRYVLTPGDTLERISPHQLLRATRACAAMVFRALSVPTLNWRQPQEN